MVRAKMKRLMILISAALMVVGSSEPVHSINQEMSGNPSGSQNDSSFQPRLGTYYYCFEFNRMNIGSASISILRDGELYKMQVYAKTNDKIDYVYKIRYRGENITDIDTVSPLETKITQKVKSTEKDILIKFQGDGTIRTSERVIKKGEPPDDEVRKVNSNKDTMDPFSATYLARGFDWKIGAEHLFVVYTGKKRYELCLKCIGKTSIEMPGGKRDTWVIVPTAKPLDADKSKSGEKKKPADVKIYLSADQDKDVLKIEASHTMGTFLVLLNRFEPAVGQDRTVRENARVSVNK
ncbi:MAG TPA: DUF3108 domain-containing protein [Deltaproteobacteria bacterium]|jgi:hypothetical protein|nr:DUF3108 domain-containing protein [Deltaproteobacteria bacterium]